MKILIVKLGALGDVVNTLPLVITLKQHFDAKIYWLVAPLSYPIVSSSPFVDETIVFDKKEGFKAVYQTICNIRKINFDLTLDLQRTLKSGAFTFLSKSSLKIGFDKKRCKELSFIFPFKRISPSNPHKHMLDQYLDFARYLKVEKLNKNFFLSSKNFDEKNTSNLALPEKFILLNIGATKEANRWSSKNFADLAKLLWEELKIQSVICGSLQDFDMADDIIKKSKVDIINLVGKTSLEELMKIIEKATMIITCDTGPMHLSVALKKQVIALFGPSDFRRTGPFNGFVIKSKAKCSPCNRRKCHNPFCMDMIQAHHVYNLVKRSL